MDAKIGLRTFVVAVLIAVLVGFFMGTCVFSAGSDRAERERIEELDRRNAELEQRLSDNSERARQIISTMATNLERQLYVATDTAGLVGALREVLRDLQDYYDNIGDYDSSSNSDGHIGEGN